MRVPNQRDDSSQPYQDFMFLQRGNGCIEFGDRAFELFLGNAVESILMAPGQFLS